tara:strand:+ start:69 stop:389 length:321 start_codon:yes stop_codon:yes gene_type:complete
MEDQEIIYTHRTRDGRKARIGAVLKTNGNDNYSVLGIVLNENGSENPTWLRDDLKRYVATYDESDLFELQPVTFYVYKRLSTGEIYVTSETFDTDHKLIDTFTKSY